LNIVRDRREGYGRLTLSFLAYGEQEAVMNPEDPRYAKALRHPLRARILTALQEREATPTELAGKFGASVGTVAYHVRTLSSLGLIELTGETRVRGAVAHHYRAVNGNGEEAEEIAGAGADVLTFDPSGCDVSKIGSFDDEDALATRASLRLDSVGWRELSQACAKLLKDADRIARSSAQRLAKDPQGRERDAGMVLFMFEAREGGESKRAGGAVS
jgi:DNA-binding transcriptional ArsR family regulator